MGFAAVLAVTLTPALAALFIRGRIRTEGANPLNRWLVRLYAPVVRGRRPLSQDRGRVAALLALLPTAWAFLQLQQRVHAAAQRGRDPLHADGAAGHVDERGDARSCSRWTAS